MSDLLPPPPRRPAPDRLRQRLDRELGPAAESYVPPPGLPSPGLPAPGIPAPGIAAPGLPPRRLRNRPVLAPLVALVAAVVVVVVAVLGVSAYRRPSTAVPAAPASPSAVETSAGPTPSASTATGSRPGPTGELAGPALTAGEITALRAACVKNQEAAQRPPASAKPVYARYDRPAGPAGPGRDPAQVLVLTAGERTWVCVDGVSDGPLSMVDLRPGGPAPAIEVGDYGGTSGECGHTDADDLRSQALFAVDDDVALARVRVDLGSTTGVWQTATALGGYVHVPVALFGDDAWVSRPTVEYEFLDRRGRTVAVRPAGDRNTPTTRRMSTTVRTCADMMRREKPEAFRPPSSVTAGVAACLKEAAEASGAGDLGRPDRWTAEAVRADARSWVAVLGDGQRRFGCSLAPTREIGEVVPDSRSTAVSSFWFAVNPIAATDGSSFWAAGRVPAGVTGITYVLPGGVRVPAAMGADGHWVAAYHVDGYDLDTEENTADWEPVRVTLTRRNGAPIEYRIPFTEQTMCRQISHGC